MESIVGFTVQGSSGNFFILADTAHQMKRLIDEYDEDWTQLWYIPIRGKADPECKACDYRDRCKVEKM